MTALTRRIALLIEYDGSAFAGSQLQKNALTVQAVLEEAIKSVTSEEVRVAFAGRTDAGVHARGQVASFLTASGHGPGVIRNALNARLPEDVAIRAAEDVAIDFDARRDALRRHYRYLISNTVVRPVIQRARVWHVSRRLDSEAMSEAARSLEGQNDFRAFASPMSKPEASTTRSLYDFSVSRRDDSVRCDVVGNAFLPNQVRRMVGALTQVGLGRKSPADYKRLLDGPTASAGPVAPARGLYLMQVQYASCIFGAAVDSSNELC